MTNVQVIGMKGDAAFGDIVNHFVGLGGDVVLINPDIIMGKNHVISAVMHADRAFEHGTNRSKTLLTEIILYVAGERQINKATKFVRPNRNEYVAAVLNIDKELDLESIGMIRDDSLVEPDPESAKRLDYDDKVSYEEQALERVAVLDLAKQ